MAAGDFAGKLPPHLSGMLGHLTVPAPSRTTLRSPRARRLALSVSDVEATQETIDRLRSEVAELRASRERLVRAAGADRRSIERELHDGPQQRLVALSVNLQLARQLADADPAAAKNLLDEMGRDLHQALDETARLAHRIYPPLLEAGGLHAALRAAAVSTGVRAHIDVAADAGYPVDIAGVAYFCCLDVLGRAGEGAQATVVVKEANGTLELELELVESGETRVAAPAASTTAAGVLDAVRDRFEALGGRLTVQSRPDGSTLVSGFLPLS